MSESKFEPLAVYETAGEIELGRGNVISNIDLAAYPGIYPVYSSSAVSDGIFGRYGHYMFDEELITWSIDGGGRPFYRKKHRYSVTNVCGFLRIKRSDLWNYRYLHVLLERLQSGIQFDYQMKAHPSVIRELYKFERIPLANQIAIAQIVDTLDTAIQKTEVIVEKLKQVKQGLLHDLLTRGVDANGELRPSYEQAPHLYKESPLGRIPKEWSLLGLHDLAPNSRSVIRTGPFGSSLKGEHWRESGRPVVTIGSLGAGEFIEEELLFVNEATARRLSEFELEPGDIAFSRVADVGRSVVVSEAQRGWIMSSNFMRISVAENKVHPMLFQLMLAHAHTVKQQMRATVNSGGRDVVNSAILMGLRFTIPQSSEQEQIINKTNVLNTRLRKELLLLEKLLAIKNALMDDLLTGRVRVTPLLAQS